MLTGQSFRLKMQTLGIETVGDARYAVQVPQGSVVKILGGPRPDDRRMVDVLWNGKALVMFAEDVGTRGEKVLDRPVHS
jgi:hypothetical protein